MIAEHPEIFPNFYSVPTQFLDHEFVKELRDFLLNGIKCARSLLVELHRAGGDMLNIFQAWRTWRGHNKDAFSGQDRPAAGSSWTSDLTSSSRVTHTSSAHCSWILRSSPTTTSRL